MTQQPWGNRPQQQGPWAPAQPQWGPASFGAPPSRVPAQNLPSPVPTPGGWPAPGTRPPARRSPLRSALVGLVVLALAGAVVMWALQQLRPGPTPSVTMGTGGYQNETYTPPPAARTMPPLPVPESVEEAAQLVRANPLYDQPLVVPTRCEAGDPDLTTASNAQLETHMNDVVACLMRVWQPPVEQAGFELPRPRVTVYDDQVVTPCGTAEGGNAFWCSADQQLYYSTTLADYMPPKVRHARWVVEEIIAHEFGHFIQGRTGIAYSSYVLEKKAATKAEGREFSRRQELQADCMAGAFLHSVAQSKNMTEAELQVIRDNVYAFGDDVLTSKPNIDGTHGHGVNRQYWMEMGMAGTLVSACNTYLASSDEVR